MHWTYERKFLQKGFSLVAGVDEVGRGPLAGPIVAAAVVFPPGVNIKGLNDSKLLTPEKREKLFIEIKRKAIAIGLAKVSHKIIDKINIHQANLLAMKRAVEDLAVRPEYLLIDGTRNRLDLPVPQMGISGGDRKCASIAAASIIAKVTRDRLMVRYHKKYPHYRFDLHKGYGTRLHVQRLLKHGPCAIHRRSFAPLSASALA